MGTHYSADHYICHTQRRAAFSSLETKSMTMTCIGSDVRSVNTVLDAPLSRNTPSLPRQFCFLLLLTEVHA